MDHNDVSPDSLVVVRALLPPQLKAISGCFADYLVQSSDERRLALLGTLQKLRIILPSWPSKMKPKFSRGSPLNGSPVLEDSGRYPCGSHRKCCPAHTGQIGGCSSIGGLESESDLRSHKQCRRYKTPRKSELI